MTPLDASALTLLVDILDAGNLSQAARKLKMTRANVSYHLNQLERAVGMQLVRRTTRRVEPTEAGLRLRYQIVPEFAPYVGVTYERAFGGTADYARAAGEKAGGWNLLVGLRSWF